MSYPMLTQRVGGLQNKIRNTIEALHKAGVDASYLNPVSQRLSDFDVIHIFGAAHGTHRIAEEAKAQRTKVVLSPVMQPDISAISIFRYHIASSICRFISRNDLRTSFDDLLQALRLSDRIVALSSLEKTSIARLLGTIPSNISVIPNGISEMFFEATPDFFKSKFNGLTGFALVVGSISTYKNQLGVIRATEQIGCQVVLVGPAGNSEYLQRCLCAGGRRVRHIGTLDYTDPLLASCYAAAGVTVLASRGEAFGNAVAESLAADTPAIITRKNGLGITPAPPALTFVDSNDIDQLSHAIHFSLNSGRIQSSCSSLVSHLRWESVAKDLIDVYKCALSA
jgi:glycosyltransferase involved in cell wall biosynthesis